MSRGSSGDLPLQQSPPPPAWPGVTDEAPGPIGLVFLWADVRLRTKFQVLHSRNETEQLLATARDCASCSSWACDGDKHLFRESTQGEKISKMSAENAFPDHHVGCLCIVRRDQFDKVV